MISSSRLRNSGRKWRADDLHDLRLDLLGRLILAQRGEILRAEVRGQDDDRVREIDRAALAVGQAPVVQHLQQDVEHVAMCLLDLVEQDDLVGPAADGLGQDTALLIADIARRSADQSGDRMLLHELRHVDADHRVRVIEQEFGERLGQLRLADAGRAEEQEGAERAVRILQARA